MVHLQKGKYLPNELCLTQTIAFVETQSETFETAELSMTD